MAAKDNREPTRTFPIAAGIFFGLGLGGFFDGIVLHQLLQWHHMLSSWYPVNSIENLELNTREPVSFIAARISSSLSVCTCFGARLTAGTSIGRPNF